MQAPFEEGTDPDMIDTNIHKTDAQNRTRLLRRRSKGMTGEQLEYVRSFNKIAAKRHRDNLRTKDQSLYARLQSANESNRRLRAELSDLRAELSTLKQAARRNRKENP